MTTLGTDAFEAWLRTRGIEWDPAYPHAHQLTYPSAPDAWRPWDAPAAPNHLPSFVAAALYIAAGSDGRLWLFARERGRWFRGTDGLPMHSRLFENAVAAAGVPRDHTCAVAFDGPRGRDAAIGVLVASMVYGWGIGEDVYAIPEDGSCVVMASHHGQLIGHFPSDAARERFDAEMPETLR